MNARSGRVRRLLSVGMANGTRYVNALLLLLLERLLADIMIQGTTIEYDSDKAKGTLKSMGWSAKRGDSLPAVWLVVHQKDFKK